MSLALKALIAGISVVGVGSAGYHHFSQPLPMPEYATLWHANVNLGTNQTIGKTYSMFLVSDKEQIIISKTGSTQTVNTVEWWNWSYRNWYYKGAISEYFKYVTSAFGEDKDVNALNQTCARMYKRSKNLIATVAGDYDKEALRRDLFLFCSPLETTPSRVLDSEYEDDTIGYRFRDKLISTNSELNSEFWKIKEEWFFSSANHHENVQEPGFKEFRLDTLSKKSLRMVCEESYGELAPVVGVLKNLEEIKVLKYCAFLIPAETRSVKITSRTGTTT